MFHRHSWYPNVELRLRFTAVFQGGGIRGLFFPGHVSGLLNAGVAKIGAYSGASAGALIAVGLWSGLLPHRILEELGSRAGRLGLLWAILSPFDIVTLIFGAILFLIIEITNFVIHLFWRLLRLRSFLSRGAPSLPMYYGCRGKRFERLINDLILTGLSDRGLHAALISDVTGKDSSTAYITFRDVLQITYWSRFVSSITQPQGDDFELVKTVYSDFDFASNNFRFGLSDRHGGIKNNILDVIYKKPTASDPYFFPLFLSLCDISTQTPIMISSIDQDCLDISIATAVRASAGHPFVFQPRNITIKDVTYPCTDGGLIYNLPTISLYRDLPRLLRVIDRGHHPYIGPTEHTDLIRSPLTIIGLTSDDFSYKPTYIKLLFGTISGAGRNYLENKIAQFAPYIRHVRHKTPLGEPHFLNFCAASQPYMLQCFVQGANLIASMNFGTRLSLENHKRDIERTVSDMCIAASKSLCQTTSDFVRAHLFVEGQDTQGVLNKKLFYYCGNNNRSFTDEELSISGQIRYAGLVGQCILSGKMVVGRLDVLQRRRKASSNETFLNLKWDQVCHIPCDIQLCFAIPIYDFRQIHYNAGRTVVTPAPNLEDCVAVVDCGISGPIAGVISLDVRALLDEDFSTVTTNLVDSFLIQTLERLTVNLSAIFSNAISAQNASILFN